MRLLDKTGPASFLLGVIGVGGWFVGLPAALVYGKADYSWPSAILFVWGITLGVALFIAGLCCLDNWYYRRRGEFKEDERW